MTDVNGDFAGADSSDLLTVDELVPEEIENDEESDDEVDDEDESDELDDEPDDDEPDADEADDDISDSSLFYGSFFSSGGFSVFSGAFGDDVIAGCCFFAVVNRLLLFDADPRRSISLVTLANHFLALKPKIQQVENKIIQVKIKT